MTRLTLDMVRALLIESLKSWCVDGEVVPGGDGPIVVRVGETELRIEGAASDLPFRWLVTVGDRTRGVAAIPGLLRAVRAVVEPGYRPVRVRIAPLPLVPP